ncbi:Peroxin 13, N-terminal region-domain-containing protein [Absidia repens]|uniref:Peroxisomal membrane protein PEX13 n=1 Tax=Absidia repens TaxID=90262 RepID=A0A1X2I774_9FUNG|nr:Peroxin 13, N-terminal region-domain-containing protein [Absidia repens]
MPSPPKPWEVNNGTTTATNVTSPSAAIAATTTTNDTNTPPIPDRSTTSMTTMNRPGAYGTSGYGQTGYGTTGYGSAGYGMGSYGSSYGGYGSSYGGYGSSYGGMGSRYGGYGSYGGMGSGYGMGGYGGGMYGGMNGYNRFGNRMGGMGGPEEPGLTQQMEMGTRATFEVVEQIVGAFGGFAQMLDSTFMATHSSFMAMVGVAEQLGHLKSYLGQVFSIFALYRLVKKLFSKVTGQTDPGKPMEMNLLEFQRFEQAAATATPKMSRKPLLIFFAMVVGLPYLMHKLIQRVSSNQQLQQQHMNQQQQQLAGMPAGAGQIDPAKLEFARATYDFTAESPMELNLKKGDIVAILSKTEPTTNATSQWWRGRLRDGTMGMFPANYVEIVQKGPAGDSSSQASPSPPAPPPQQQSMDSISLNTS